MIRVAAREGAEFGIDPSRFTITMGPARDTWSVELWVVPAGATPPTPER